MSDRRSNDLERAAEAHFLIKPVLKRALTSMSFTEDGLKFVNYKYKNKYEQYIGSFSDKFEDMTTVIRLGAAIEFELRSFYMEKKCYRNISELKMDSDYKQGIFQRIMPWHVGKGSAQNILKNIDFDMHSTNYVRSAQEVMMHRHLYAHNIGIIDNKYIEEWSKLTGEDLFLNNQLDNYQNEDTYWFKPLDGITEYINLLRKFVREMV